MAIVEVFRYALLHTQRSWPFDSAGEPIFRIYCNVDAFSGAHVFITWQDKESCMHIIRWLFSNVRIEGATYVPRRLHAGLPRKKKVCSVEMQQRHTFASRRVHSSHQERP